MPSASLAPDKSALSASFLPTVVGPDRLPQWTIWEPRAFGYQRHPRGIYAGRSSAPSVRRRAGAAFDYGVPQNTETEMPFVDDLDSPGVLLDRATSPLIMRTRLGAIHRWRFIG